MQEFVKKLSLHTNTHAYCIFGKTAVVSLQTTLNDRVAADFKVVSQLTTPNGIVSADFKALSLQTIARRVGLHGRVTEG